MPISTPSFLGDFNPTETVHIPFNTFTSDDPRASITVTDLAAGDIEIHKDGGVTQRTSDAGVTVSIDFDGVTGNHMAHIDLSDNTQAGFYASGSRYSVRVEGITVDVATLNSWIGSFSIDCALRGTTAGNTLDVSATGEGGLDFANIKDATGAHTLTNITVPVTTTVTGGATGAKLLAYIQLLARSDSAIATDNATELTAINADGGSGAGDYANTTESQEALGDSIVITSPAAFFPVAASTIVAGTEGGTYADAISDNATYWSATDAGTAIQVIVQSEIGDGRLPTSVVINGYFDSGASRVVEGFKYDYTLDDWVKVSAGTADTEMQNRISDFSYVFPLGFNDHDHTAANHGEVKFKLLADTQNNGDVLYIDQVIFNAQPEGGLTTDTIAQAVANFDVLNVVSDNGGIPFGHAAKSNIDLQTTIATTDSQTSFTLTDGIAVDDIYNGQPLSVRDTSSETRDRVTRRIIDYTSGRVVTLNRALGFDPAVGDDIHILAATGDVNTTHLSETSQTARDIGASVLLSSGSGAGQLDFTSGVVKSNLAQILGTALTETAGYITAGFKKLFNVASPVMTVENVNQSADNDTKISTFITQVGTAGAGLTDLGGMSTGMKAEVNAETDTALTDYGANTTVPDAVGTAASLHTTTDGKVDAIQTDLDNATDGLGALKTLIDTVNTDLSNGTDGLGALKTLIDAIKAATDDLPGGFARGVQITFPFNMVSSTDHYTPLPGLSVTAKISKDSGAFSSCSNSVSETAYGFYKIVLTATELTADSVTLIFIADGADQRNITLTTEGS